MNCEWAFVVVKCKEKEKKWQKKGKERRGNGEEERNETS